MTTAIRIGHLHCSYQVQGDMLGILCLCCNIGNSDF